MSQGMEDSFRERLRRHARTVGTPSSVRPALDGSHPHAVDKSANRHGTIHSQLFADAPTVMEATLASHRLSARAQRKLVAILVDRQLGGDEILGGLCGIRDAEAMPAFSAAVEALLGVRVTDCEGESLVLAILRHRGILSSSLGRDPGLQVAAEDYFTSLHPAQNEFDPASVPDSGVEVQRGSLDLVSGLQSAASFRNEIELELRRSRRHGLSFALLTVDLRGILVFQDSHGRLFCDEVLHNAAQALRRTLRDADRSGRCSANEFGVLLVETDRRGAHAAAERLLDAIVRSFSAWNAGELLELRDLRAGVACFPGDGHTLESLRTHAAQALNSAAEAGGIRVEVHRADRRTHGRQPPRAGFELELGSGAGSAGRVGEVVDVSRSGVLVEVDGSFQPQERLGLIVATRSAGGDTTRCRVTGRIVRMEPVRGGGGVRFGIAFDGLLAVDWADGGSADVGNPPPAGQG